MAMHLGSAARLASLARASSLAWAASCGWMPALAKIVGSSAGGGVGDLERLMHRGWAFADADGEDGLDTGGVGAAKNLVAVFGVEVEMGVGVDQGHGSLS